jgi:hypothetical protein
MYHKASISPLSSTQISKILNGHSVRVSAGNGHDIELSKEQLKKFAKAQKTGKGMTLTMDPFQMQNHQHLRGSGNLKRTAKGSAKRLIVAGTDRLIRSIEGSGIGGNIKKTAKGSAKRLIVAGTDRLIRSIEGSGIGGNIKAVGKDSGKRLIVAGTDRAIQAIEGSGVNRLKKYQRWTGAINKTIRDGIDTSGKAARVYYDSTGPMAQLGFGLKKRGRPKRGGALMPAGIP